MYIPDYFIHILVFKKGYYLIFTYSFLQVLSPIARSTLWWSAPRKLKTIFLVSLLIWSYFFKCWHYCNITCNNETWPNLFCDLQELQPYSTWYDSLSYLSFFPSTDVQLIGSLGLQWVEQVQTTQSNLLIRVPIHGDIIVWYEIVHKHAPWTENWRQIRMVMEWNEEKRKCKIRIN